MATKIDVLVVTPSDEAAKQSLLTGLIEFKGLSGHFNCFDRSGVLHIHFQPGSDVQSVKEIARKCGAIEHRDFSV